MGELANINDFWVPSESSDFGLDELLSLYNTSSLILEECAHHIPNIDPEADALNAQKEILHLKRQNAILDKAKEITLKQDDDVKALLQLCLKDVSHNFKDMTLSDSVILSMCNYFGVPHEMRS